jgi:hypothetical protein
MDTPERTPAQSLVGVFERRAETVLTVCQMSPGLGLALILKAYMLVFTAFARIADTQTPRNLIRCSPTIEIVSQFLILTTGVRFAALKFSATLTRISGARWVAVASSE